MKERNFTIDINRLDVTQLEQLRAMFYEAGRMNEAKEINDRIAFINGWMPAAQEEEHYNNFCK